MQLLRWEVRNKEPSVAKPIPLSLKIVKPTSIHARMMPSLTKNVEEATEQDTVGTKTVAGPSSCKSKASAAQHDDSCRYTTRGARVYNASFSSGPNLEAAALDYPNIAFLKDSGVSEDEPRPPRVVEAFGASPSVPLPEVLVVPGIRIPNPSGRIERRKWNGDKSHPLARALTGLDATQANDPAFHLMPISNHQWSQTLGSSSKSRESHATVTDNTAEPDEKATKRRTYTPLKLRDVMATKGCKDSKENGVNSEGSVGNKRRRRGKGKAKLLEGQNEGKKSGRKAGRNEKRPLDKMLDDPRPELNVVASEDASARKRCKNSASAVTSRVSPTTPVTSLSKASKLDMLSSVAHADLAADQTSKLHIDGQEASVTLTVGETDEGDTSNLEILSSLAGSLAFQYSVTKHLLAATR